jgi:hypothetical protein
MIIPDSIAEPPPRRLSNPAIYLIGGFSLTLLIGLLPIPKFMIFSFCLFFVLFGISPNRVPNQI